MPIFRHKLLKVNGMLESRKPLEQRNILWRRTRVQYLVEDGADQQDTKGIKQSHHSHEHNGENELQPIWTDVFEQPRQLRHESPMARRHIRIYSNGANPNRRLRGRV